MGGQHASQSVGDSGVVTSAVKPGSSFLTKRGTVVRQRTLSPMQGHLLEFCDAACAVRVEVAGEGRCGNGAQALDVVRCQPLTLQGESFHVALYPRVRVVKSPVMQRFPLGCGTLDLVHRRASW